MHEFYCIIISFCKNVFVLFGCLCRYFRLCIIKKCYHSALLYFECLRLQISTTDQSSNYTLHLNANLHEKNTEIYFRFCTEIRGVKGCIPTSTKSIQSNSNNPTNTFVQKNMIKLCNKTHACLTQSDHHSLIIKHEFHFVSYFAPHSVENGNFRCHMPFNNSLQCIHIMR